MPSPRANGRLASGPRGAHLFEIPGTEPPSDLVGSLAALMEHTGRGSGRQAPERSIDSLVALMKHAGRRIRAPSPRANGWLAYGPHGARRKGNPSAEPPSQGSARLWPSWGTPEWDSWHRAPDRSVDSLVALMEHAKLQEIFIRSLNASSV